MSHDSLRIAILCPGYGRVMRGVETFTHEIASRLVECRPSWQVDIFSRGPTSEVAPGVRSLHVPALDRDGRASALYAKIGHRLRWYLRTRIDAECLSFTLGLAPGLLGARYDVVFNQAGPFTGELLRMKRRLNGTPFVHKTASGYGELELLMARQYPDAVIATSPYAADWLAVQLRNLRVEYIPNAVDRSAFRPYSAQDIDASRNGSRLFDMPRPRVLFVGAMDPMKRPELLVSAVERVPDASLVMVGTGLLAESIVRTASDRLGDRFLYVPKVDREHMPLYYNACDLFSLPSEEPFGIAFVEAMACNKPVLGHNSPVQEWIFGDGGMTCDCTNIEEYARAIRTMLASDYGNRPLERSRAFDWSEVVPRYAELFQSVCANRRRA